MFGVVEQKPKAFSIIFVDEWNNCTSQDVEICRIYGKKRSKEKKGKMVSWNILVCALIAFSKFCPRHYNMLSTPLEW